MLNGYAVRAYYLRNSPNERSKELNLKLSSLNSDQPSPLSYPPETEASPPTALSIPSKADSLWLEFHAPSSVSKEVNIDT